MRRGKKRVEARGRGVEVVSGWRRDRGERWRVSRGVTNTQQ